MNDPGGIGAKPGVTGHIEAISLFCGLFFWIKFVLHVLGLDRALDYEQFAEHYV